jgi:peptidoglycan DL-endopeptidase CwlO
MRRAPGEHGYAKKHLHPNPTAHLAGVERSDVARQHVGRHRAPGYNPLNEIADIATRSAQPAMKASAVAVASGGLVATFAIPASAAPSDEGSGAVAAGAAAGPAAAPAAAPALAVAAPAVDLAALPNFGVVGFTAQAAATKALAPIEISKIAAPALTTDPAPAAPARASRTTTRTTTTAPAPTTSTTPAKTTSAPAAAAPAPTGGIIGIAASLSGIPYVWGGTTTSGFDCSGFTSYVYRQVGKSIPRTAEAQRAASSKVSNPVPGDLIFFGYPAYHVGIYAGGGQMYDAPKPGRTTGLHVIWTQTNVSYGRF